MEQLTKRFAYGNPLATPGKYGGQRPAGRDHRVLTTTCSSTMAFMAFMAFVVSDDNPDRDGEWHLEDLEPDTGRPDRAAS